LQYKIETDKVYHQKGNAGMPCAACGQGHQGGGDDTATPGEQKTSLEQAALEQAALEKALLHSEWSLQLPTCIEGYEHAIKYDTF